VDYYSGDLAQMLGLQRQFRETDIAPLGKISATPGSRCAKRDATADAPNVETYVYRCPNAPRFAALVYRDSMAIPLIPMLAENFSRTTFVTSTQIDPELVERLRPDIVIEELVERTLPGLAAFPMPR
jgi:alginate O-acetyltransferase complex protein AlgJ